MSNVVATPAEIRKQLRTIPASDFIRAHTKDALIGVAGTLDVTLENATGTKQEIYDVIIAGANLPDPALRGNSTVAAPVGRVWVMADAMIAAVPKENRARRSEVVAACQADGIAYYTARTQFQAWFTATDKGRRRLDDLSLEELPKALHPTEEKDAA